jgi:hypothetical protein
MTTLPEGTTPLSLDPVALARAAHHFLDGVELLEYICPRVSYSLDDLARGREPVPGFAPDRRNRDPSDISLLLKSLRNLETQFNPERLRHRDPRRIMRIAAWAEVEEQFQLCQKPSRGS